MEVWIRKRSEVTMDFYGVVYSAFSGLLLGSLYALMTMGLSIVWTTLRFVNFAHGSILTFGAYVMWTLFVYLGVDYRVSFFITIAATFLLAVLLERLFIRPLRVGALREVSPLISTLTISLVIQNLLIIGFGGRYKKVPALSEGFIKIGTLGVDLHTLSIGLISLSTLVIFYLYLKWTKVGMGIRAVAQDITAARLMGINIDNVYIFTMGIGGALSACAGILLGSVVYITPTMGGIPGFKALIICVFGGINNVKGTIFGAFIVGVIEAVAQYVLAGFWALPVLFVIMMIVLVIKPEGLFGLEEEMIER